MSKLIADLLGVDVRNLQSMTGRLEHMLLTPGVDVRLTAEIITNTREKIRSLGLDPADTKPEEFYFALLAKAKKCDILLRAKFDINSKTETSEVSKIIAHQCEKKLETNVVACIDSKSVRAILKSVPPKKTLKALKFRSIESVLKREDPRVLYSLAKILEDKSWHTQAHARLKRLNSRDIHETQISVLSFPQSWMDKMTNKTFNKAVVKIPEIGSVVIMPNQSSALAGSVLLLSSVIIQTAQQMSIESLPYRMQSLSTGIEKLIPLVAKGVSVKLDTIHGLQPTWRAVYRLVATQSRALLPDFEFLIGDLDWETTEVKLASIVPEIDFWVNSNYLGTSLGDIVTSLHLVDVSANLTMKRSYMNQIKAHMRSSLSNELQLRYLRHEVMERSIVNQLSALQGLRNV